MEEEKDKGGRPETIIEQSMFEALCKIQCIKNEICAVLNCDEKTLTKWCKKTYGEGFSDTYKKKSQSGHASLRRNQWKAAEGGNTTMLIWLGKQYLGQKDSQDLNLFDGQDRIDRDEKARLMREEMIKKFSQDGI